MSQKSEAEPLDSVELGSHKSHHTSGKHSDKHEEASAAHPVVSHGGHGDHGHEVRLFFPWFFASLMDN